MSNDFNLDAELRTDLGKGASRRLRLQNKVPAILYGGEGEPVSLTLPANVIARALQEESFYSSIIMLTVDGKTERTILRDLQRHPYKQTILHMDFQRLVAGQEITVNIPLHFINEDTCVGVKTGGGLISHTMTELEVSCRPRDLPEYIEVDMADVELGGAVHISDIKLPEGVTSIALSHGEDHDLSVAAVHVKKGGSDVEEVEDDSDAAGEEKSDDE